MSRIVPSYTLTRRRMRSMRMRVAPGTGELRVSAPLRTPKKAIDDWVIAQETWITRHRQIALAQPAPLAPGPEADALRRVLRPVVAELLDEWIPHMGVPTPTWRVRIMTSRWGSCNKERRSLTFALSLALKERHLVEYVVVHELAHLIEANHGPGFYAVMDRHLPDWKQRRRELNGRSPSPLPEGSRG